MLNQALQLFQKDVDYNSLEGAMRHVDRTLKPDAGLRQVIKDYLTLAAPKQGGNYPRLLGEVATLTKSPAGRNQMMDFIRRSRDPLVQAAGAVPRTTGTAPAPGQTSISPSRILTPEGQGDRRVEVYGRNPGEYDPAQTQYSKKASDSKRVEFGLEYLRKKLGDDAFERVKDRALPYLMSRVGGYRQGDVRTRPQDKPYIAPTEAADEFIRALAVNDQKAISDSIERFKKVRGTEAKSQALKEQARIASREGQLGGSVVSQITQTDARRRELASQPGGDFRDAELIKNAGTSLASMASRSINQYTGAEQARKELERMAREGGTNTGYDDIKQSLLWLYSTVAGAPGDIAGMAVDIPFEVAVATSKDATAGERVGAVANTAGKVLGAVGSVAGGGAFVKGVKAIAKLEAPLSTKIGAMGKYLATEIYQGNNPAYMIPPEIRAKVANALTLGNPVRNSITMQIMEKAKAGGANAQNLSEIKRGLDALNPIEFDSFVKSDGAMNEIIGKYTPKKNQAKPEMKVVKATRSRAEVVTPPKQARPEVSAEASQVQSAPTDAELAALQKIKAAKEKAAAKPAPEAAPATAPAPTAKPKAESKPKASAKPEQPKPPEKPSPKFSLPKELSKASPNYGLAKIEFASDYDKTAYILARDSIKASKSAEKFRNALIDAGENVDDAIAHGMEVIKELRRKIPGRAPQEAMSVRINEVPRRSSFSEPKKSAAPTKDVPTSADKEVPNVEKVQQRKQQEEGRQEGLLTKPAEGAADAAKAPEAGVTIEEAVKSGDDAIVDIPKSPEVVEHRSLDRQDKKPLPEEWKKERVGADGFRPSQKKYLTEKIAAEMGGLPEKVNMPKPMNVAYSAAEQARENKRYESAISEFRSENKSVSVAVPGDGEWTMYSQEQAKALLKALGVKPNNAVSGAKPPKWAGANGRKTIVGSDFAGDESTMFRTGEGKPVVAVQNETSKPDLTFDEVLRRNKITDPVNAPKAVDIKTRVNEDNKVTKHLVVRFDDGSTAVADKDFVDDVFRRGLEIRRGSEPKDAGGGSWLVAVDKNGSIEGVSGSLRMSPGDLSAPYKAPKPTTAPISEPPQGQPLRGQARIDAGLAKIEAAKKKQRKNLKGGKQAGAINIDPDILNGYIDMAVGHLENGVDWVKEIPKRVKEFFGTDPDISMDDLKSELESRGIIDKDGKYVKPPTPPTPPSTPKAGASPSPEGEPKGFLEAGGTPMPVQGKPKAPVPARKEPVTPERKVFNKVRRDANRTPIPKPSANRLADGIRKIVEHEGDGLPPGVPQSFGRELQVHLRAVARAYKAATDEATRTRLHRQWIDARIAFGKYQYEYGSGLNKLKSGYQKNVRRPITSGTVIDQVADILQGSNKAVRDAVIKGSEPIVKEASEKIAKAEKTVAEKTAGKPTIATEYEAAKAQSAKPPTPPKATAEPKKPAGSKPPRIAKPEGTARQRLTQAVIKGEVDFGEGYIKGLTARVIIPAGASKDASAANRLNHGSMATVDHKVLAELIEAIAVQAAATLGQAERKVRKMFGSQLTDEDYDRAYELIEARMIQREAERVATQIASRATSDADLAVAEDILNTAKAATQKRPMPFDDETFVEEIRKRVGDDVADQAAELLLNTPDEEKVKVARIIVGEFKPPRKPKPDTPQWESEAISRAKVWAALRKASKIDLSEVTSIQTAEDVSRKISMAKAALKQAKIKGANMPAKEYEAMQQAFRDLYDQRVQLRNKLAALKAKADMQTADQKVWDALARALNIPRTLKASMDLSFGSRQGAALAAANPKIWAPLWRNQLKAVFKTRAGAERYMAQLADEVRRANVYDVFVRDMDPKYAVKFNFDSTGFEEVSDFAPEKLQKFAPIRMSNDAYAAAGDTIRWKFLEQEYDGLVKYYAKKGQPVPREALEQLAMFVNIASGKGHGAVADMLGRHPAFGVTFFAPKFRWSRYQYAGLYPLGRLITSKVKNLNRGDAQIAWNYIKFASYRSLQAALVAHLTGATIGSDPSKDDFGKVTIGDRQYDMTGGTGPIIRQVADALRGAGASGHLSTDTLADVSAREAKQQDITRSLLTSVRGALAPVPGTAWTWLSGGKTITGQQLAAPDTLQGVADYAEQLGAPISLTDTISSAKMSARQGESPIKGALMASPGIVGFNVSSYERGRKAQTSAERMIMGMSGAKSYGASEPRTEDQRRAVAMAQRAADKGTLEGRQEAAKIIREAFKGDSPAKIKSLIEAVATPILGKAKDLNVSEVVGVLTRGNPTDAEILDIHRKYGWGLKMMPSSSYSKQALLGEKNIKPAEFKKMSDIYWKIVRAALARENAARERATPSK